MHERRSTEKTTETFSKTSGPELILTHIPNLIASLEQKKDLKPREKHSLLHMKQLMYTNKHVITILDMRELKK